MRQVPARFRLPPPPRGLCRRGRVVYVAVAAVVSAVATVTIPMCPLADSAGRPLWRVDHVHDGDTVTCLDERGGARRIRLLGIDAPEYGQPFGDAARRALAGKLAGGVVRVEGDAIDQHGRLLGTLWVGERNLNQELVAEGLAWAFAGFAPDEDLLAAEEAARAARRGLWSSSDPPVSPQDWRAAHPRVSGGQAR
jgi:micrococcal nuclease